MSGVRDTAHTQEKPPPPRAHVAPSQDIKEVGIRIAHTCNPATGRLRPAAGGWRVQGLA